MSLPKPPTRAVILVHCDNADELSYGDNFGNFRPVRNEMLDHRRWSIVHELIIQDISDNTFWRATYEVGATENQDYYHGSGRWGADREGNVTFTQVFPKIITTTVYE